LRQLSSITRAIAAGAGCEEAHGCSWLASPAPLPVLDFGEGL